MADSECPGDHERILEEQLSFQERELEHCRHQFRDLWSELRSAQKRLEHLERLVESKLRGESEDC